MKSGEGFRVDLIGLWFEFAASSELAARVGGAASLFTSSCCGITTGGSGINRLRLFESAVCCGPAKASVDDCKSLEAGLPSLGLTAGAAKDSG